MIEIDLIQMPLYNNHTIHNAMFTRFKGDSLFFAALESSTKLLLWYKMYIRAQTQGNLVMLTLFE